ncbi:hypothetical protein D3C81_1828450 [compost metagenome]
MSYAMIMKYADEIISNNELRAEMKVENPKWWDETFRRKCAIDHLYSTGKIDLDQYHTYYKNLRRHIYFQIENYPFHVGFLRSLENDKPIEKLSDGNRKTLESLSNIFYCESMDEFLSTIVHRPDVLDLYLSS